MSVLDPELRTAPRSAHYQPHPVDRAQPGPFVARRSRVRPAARITAARVAPDDLDQDEKEPDVPLRRSAGAPTSRRETTPPRRTKRRVHPLLLMSTGLLVALLLWISVTQVIAWGNGVLDLLRYGNPRTSQTDAVVGQGDTAQHPSHFIALNLHGQIVILDFPAGDPTRAREFTVSSILGPNADLVVVTLRFVDINHNGKPDMIIDAGGAQTFLVNADGTFRPPTPAEQQQILQALSS